MAMIQITDLWPEPKIEPDGHWVDIEGYEGLYQISRFGNIRRIRGSILKQYLPLNRYFQVCLYKNGSPNLYLCHRLAAKTFVPNPENKHEVNHINGIKSDNRVINLEWVTSSENSQHATNTGLQKIRGEDNSCSKITESQVISIRHDRDNGMKLRDIVKKYNTPYHATHKIVSNKNWKHLIK